MKQRRWMVVLCIVLSCAVLMAGVSTATAALTDLGLEVTKFKVKPKGDASDLKCRIVVKSKISNFGSDALSDIVVGLYLSPDGELSSATPLDSFTIPALGAGGMVSTVKKELKLSKKVPINEVLQQYAIVAFEALGETSGPNQFFMEQVTECGSPASSGGTTVGGPPPGPLASGPEAAVASVILGFAGIGSPQPPDLGGSEDSGGGTPTTPSDIPADLPFDFPIDIPGLPDFELPDFPSLPDLPSLPSFLVGASPAPQSSTHAVVTPCSGGGTQDVPFSATGGSTVFEDCSTPVDTTGDGISDANQIKTGTITTNITDAEITADTQLTTRVEGASGQFISQDITTSNSQTTNIQTENCEVLGTSFPLPVQTSTVVTLTMQETADTNGDGTVDKDVETTSDSQVNTTLGIGATSICDTVSDLSGSAVTVSASFSGNGTAVDNVSGQTSSVTVDQGTPVSTTITSSFDGGESRLSVDGNGKLNLSLPCVNGNVAFTIVDSVIVQGDTPVAGQISISGAVSATVNISADGVQVTGDDGTSGFVNLAVIDDLAWACSPPDF